MLLKLINYLTNSSIQRKLAKKDPVITVALITYNHSEYIAQSIESVLGQTFKDWELVIVNDGSTDSTEAIALSYDDPRIRVITQINQGPSAATNTALNAARGKYVALLSGDDLCRSDRLEKQYARAIEKPGKVFFSACEIVDYQNEPVEESHYLRELFCSKQRTRAEIFAKFFHYGNFICGPSCFAETELFKSLGDYDPSLYQLQDYSLWIDVIKRYDIEILEEPLLYYRVLPNGGNLSSTAPEKLRRSAYEHYLIMRRFFNGISLDFFLEAFGEKLVHPEDLDSTSLRYEQAQLFLKASSNRPLNSLIAIEYLRDLLSVPASAEILKAKYDFTAASFAELLFGLDQLEVA